jgi:hypothetical protein
MPLAQISGLESNFALQLPELSFRKEPAIGSCCGPSESKRVSETRGSISASKANGTRLKSAHARVYPHNITSMYGKMLICLDVRQSCKNINKNTQWPEFESELYRPSDRRLSAKLVPTFADRVCHVVSVTDPYGRNLGFLDRSRYFSFQAAPQLYSRG